MSKIFRNFAVVNEVKRHVSDDFRAMVNAMPELVGLVDALERSEPEVSVRLNPGKHCDTTALAADAKDTVPWCKEGHYLTSRPAFTLDPAMHQGRYYVQDASSMFVSHAISQIAAECDAPQVILDACAAPGGKSTAMLDAAPEGSVLVANEYVPLRAAVLKENLIKWGNPNVIVTQGDTSRLSRLRDRFDIILIDAPCSGEGMMRKEPRAIEQWSPALIVECADRQREIINNLWPTLKPGGVMIYSTCTFNRTENEDMVRYIIDNYGGETINLHPDPDWRITPGIDTPHHCYRFLPGRTRGEGLFMAAIKKPGSPNRATAAKHVRAPKIPKTPKEITDWLINADNYTFSTNDTFITAFPSTHASLLKDVEKATRVLHAGITVAQAAGKGFEPTQSLAMTTALNRDAFTCVELDRMQALDYLRRQAILLPDDTPRGYTLLTWQQQPLGFVKNLGSRANNLYPKEWRVRTL